ncbi:hypothetical protein CDD83_4307 [Cordyceps sp. RAO-2017]|nr:hypothetical protein CDD83_4307 [Cordyceps sp. RAO-2017]
MDVFLRNVPLDLAEGSLRKELKPVMNVLGVVDWDCSKSRRKNFAFVSFLQLADGERFLAKHGAVAAAAAPPPDPSSAAATFKSLPFLGARPRQLARLHILSLPVYASRSRRPIDRQTLSALERDHDVRQQQQQQQQQQRGAGAASVRCPLLDVACGKMVFAGPSGADLVFAHQTGLRARAQLRFGRRNLSAVFDDDGDRMDVPYDILVDLVADHATKALTLVLSEPPRFYARLPEPPDPRRGGHVRWERVAALPRWADHDRYVAHCLVYQLWLGPAHDEAVRSLRQLDLVAVSRHRVLLEPRPEPFVHDYGTAVGRFNGRIQSPDVNRLVPFALLFQVQLLVWNNYLHPSGALAVLDVLERAAKTTEATAATATAAKRDFPFKADSMKLLLPKIPYPVPGTEPASLDPTRLMETAARLEMERYREDLHRRGVYGPPLPGHQTWVFKAMVTPTRILLQGPDAESKNRVLRMFPDHGDHFLRVSFCDEDGQDLPFNPKVSNEAALERYRRVLRDGIHIAGRRFSFLGFSHSSLRSHSTWPSPRRPTPSTWSAAGS